MVRPLSIAMMSNPLLVPTASTNNVPQPTMVPKSNNDPPPNVPRDHGYTFKQALKIPSSYPHTHQYSSPDQVDKTVKNEEHEEMTRKIKSLEQRVRDDQRLSPSAKIELLLLLDLCHREIFAEVIKVGEMVENGIKSRKIGSQAILKATTQVLQNGSGNLGGKKRREDVTTVVPVPQTYVQDNYPQHYFPSLTPQYPIQYSQYHIFSTQPIAPPSYLQRRAPTPQNHPPPPTNSPKYC
ncbi:hypothetical protein RDI58_013333 [Solanum bulbocastanum]|uniref:Uncharacterized protein n=1 Tax=Solanum bulbocastanum TaxID=147425 RepID=A0AAN8TRI0_SOLBU